MRNTYNILVGDLKGKEHLRDISTDGRIILRWITRKECVRMWAESGSC
jgi:hypothetical protein